MAEVFARNDQITAFGGLRHLPRSPLDPHSAPDVNRRLCALDAVRIVCWSSLSARARRKWFWES